MNRLVKPAMRLLAAFILCLLLNATATFAQELKDSQKKPLPMPNSEATRCLTVISCDRLIQALVVELWKETALAQKAEKDAADVIRERSELETDRNKWRQLYTAEKEANSSLASSNLDLIAATNKFKSEDELNRSIINAQSRKIRRFRLEKFLYSGASFGAGIGAGYFIGNRNSRDNGVRLNF